MSSNSAVCGSPPGSTAYGIEHQADQHPPLSYVNYGGQPLACRAGGAQATRETARPVREDMDIEKPENELGVGSARRSGDLGGQAAHRRILITKVFSTWCTSRSSCISSHVCSWPPPAGWSSTR